MNSSKIISLSKTCKANVEKYEKAKVGTHNYATLAYIFSKKIINIDTKEIGVKNVPLSENPTGTLIDEEIPREDYKRLCQLYVNSVDKNNKCPPYLAYNKHKIAPWVWTYTTARILVYYWENKKLPSKILATYKAFRTVDGEVLKYSKIVSLAKNVIANVEKYKKAQTGKYDYSTLAYLFSKSVLSPKEDIQFKKVPLNSNPELGDVDGGVGIKNFQNICQTYVNSVNKKNVAPPYLAFNNNKIGITTWTYATARVVVYYWEKKRLPNKVLMSYKHFYIPPKPPAPEPEPEPEPPEPVCESPYVSSPHYHDCGCNRLGQCNAYCCGPHALHQGLRKFDITDFDEYDLMEYAGTTTDGTDHDGLNTAVAVVSLETGIELDVEWKNFSDFGSTTDERFKGLGEVICQPNKAVLLHIGYQCGGECDEGEICGHYEMLDRINTETRYVRALNSLGDRCDYPHYCGHLQDRSFNLQAHYISQISQKSVMIITKK